MTQVFYTMTDNLSVNQKSFKLLKEMYPPSTLSTITHLMKNIYFKLMTLGFDPTHMLKNIKNNWVTKKTQTLRITDPDNGNKVTARWSDIKTIYKDEASNFIKTTKLDYATVFPNNYEKQKVSLVLNVFNEKT